MSISQEEAVLEICLYNGVTDEGAVSELLDPTVSLSASDFADIDAIAETLLFSDKIAVHGDYDADGIMSCAVVKRYLPDAQYYVPEREIGYGLSLFFVESLSEGSTLITVDCGITAKSQIAAATNKGIRSIVTDHHNPSRAYVPENCLVVNPKLSANNYHDLAGAGVAYLLLREIYGEDRSAAQYAAIGTISDVMPVTGVNRRIIKNGLDYMRASPTPQIAELVRRSGSRLSVLNEDDIGWKIGPMINACGRLGNANLALDYFTSDHDHGEVAAISKQIEKANNERKAISGKMAEEALSTYVKYGLFAVAYLENQDGHGILGLVANKMANDLQCPSIILSEGELVTTGSTRAPSWFDCYSIIAETRSLLSNGGGHRGAAGFSFPKENTELFLSAISNYAMISDGRELPERVSPEYIYINTNDLDLWLEAQERMRPYGPGFQKPLFRIDGVPSNITAIGSNKDHLRFDLNGISAIYFGGAKHIDTIGKGSKFLCKIGMNYFAGKETVQLEIKDFK